MFSQSASQSGPCVWENDKHRCCANNVPDTPHVHASTRKYIMNTKSRKGCSECKRKRVKCDEAKPVCTRCSKSRRPNACDYGLKLSWTQGRPFKKQRLEVESWSVAGKSTSADGLNGQATSAQRGPPAVEAQVGLQNDDPTIDEDRFEDAVEFTVGEGHSLGR